MRASTVEHISKSIINSEFVLSLRLRAILTIVLLMTGMFNVYQLVSKASIGGYVCNPVDG